MLLNPVFLSVVILCVLCLCKLNVLMSLILSALCGAVLASIPVPEAMNILCGGFGANAGTALAYIFLGAFAAALPVLGPLLRGEKAFVAVVYLLHPLVLHLILQMFLKSRCTR